MNDLSRRLSNLYSAVVFDTMTAIGIPDHALAPEITALSPGTTIAGPAWPFSGRINKGASIDETLLSWTGFLSAAPSGHVIVCQPNDHTIAHMGELSAETLQIRGSLGYVVDGGCRDVDRVNTMGFPVFCRYATPADVGGRWMVDTIGEPIEISGVSISHGDYVIADADGVVVVPANLAEDIVTKAETKANTEDALREAIRGGADPQEAYKKHKVF